QGGRGKVQRLLRRARGAGPHAPAALAPAERERHPGDCHRHPLRSRTPRRPRARSVLTPLSIHRGIAMKTDSQFEHYAATIANLPADFAAQLPLPATLRMTGDKRHEVYYAPFDHVTPSARVV